MSTPSWSTIVALKAGVMGLTCHILEEGSEQKKQ